ncbi:MerR family transcriptional regulator, partial [Tetragenococcus koreensis]
MNKYYSIGEISTITGISKNTLNFYLNKELLFPCFINESGYR